MPLGIKNKQNIIYTVIYIQNYIYRIIYTEEQNDIIKTKPLCNFNKFFQ